MTREASASDAVAAAWSRYDATVARLRESMLDTPRVAYREHNRVRAYYSLREAQAMSYNLAVAPRMSYPTVQSHTSWMTHFYTLGGNCADFHYGALFLDGRRDYRITGRFGDLELILLQVFKHLMGHPKWQSVGNYDLSDFQIEEDGSFEIIASATERDGNWMRLDPESDRNYVFIRRAVPDWYGDKGELVVTPLTEDVTDEVLTASWMAERLDLATDYFTFLIDTLGIGFYDICLDRAGGRRNVVAPMPGDEIDSELAGSPTSHYDNAIFDIEPGHALIVELDVPEVSALWSLQLYDVWLKSLDFAHHQSDLNMHRIHIDEDGKARAVICLSDPGVPNWLDPVGVQEGILMIRNYRGLSPLNPVMRLVALDELRDHLPAGTPVVTADERARVLEHRRLGFDRTYS